MNNVPAEKPPAADPPRALANAVFAFAMWGILPIYWKAAAAIGSTVIVAHRVWGTLFLLIPLLLFRGEFAPWIQALKTPKLLRIHGTAAFLLTINWCLFIWANQHGRIVEASVGYFLNPLLNVLIGAVILGESLSRGRKISVALAAIGVLMQVIIVGHLPWIALALASTFAIYGLVRRQSPLGSLAGLAVETLLALPFAIGWLIYSNQNGAALLGSGSWLDVLLVCFAGIITALPLLAFAYAARELRFSTLGLLQFIAPTGQFLIGVLMYHEPLTGKVLFSFLFIWAGVAVFCFDSLRKK